MKPNLVPVDVYIESKDGPFRIMSPLDDPIRADIKRNHVTLHTTELIELLIKTFKAGKDRCWYEDKVSKGISPFVHNPDCQQYVNDILQP